MIEIYKNKFVEVFLAEENYFLMEIWKPESSNITEAEFKAYLLYWRDNMLTHKIEKILTNCLYFGFILQPVVQTWIVENVSIPVAQANFLKKHAFVMPQEFIANLSIEQYIDDVNEQKDFITRYFDSETEAKKWLLA